MKEVQTALRAIIFIKDKLIESFTVPKVVRQSFLFVTVKVRCRHGKAPGTEYIQVTVSAHNACSDTQELSFYSTANVVRGSSIGIAIRYGLVGSGIEFRYGRDYPHPSMPFLVPTHPFTSTIGTGSLSRG